jgi:hypothetical protein
MAKAREKSGTKFACARSGQSRDEAMLSPLKRQIQQLLKGSHKKALPLEEIYSGLHIPTDAVQKRTAVRIALDDLMNRGLVVEYNHDQDSRGIAGSELPSIDPSLLNDVGGFVNDPEAWFYTPNEAFEGRRPVGLLGTADEPRLRNRIEAAKLGMFS